MIDALSVAVRAVSFLCVFQCTGLVLFLALFEGELSGSRSALRRLALRSAVCGGVCVLVHAALEPARLAGELAGVADPSLVATALGSGAGAAAATRLLGLAGIGLALRCGWPVLALIGTMLTLSSFLLTGHTTVSPLHALLSVLLAAHLIGVAFWFGALPGLSLAARRESMQRVAVVLRRFSRLALWLVPGILAAGLALACSLVPSLATLSQPYGIILLGKLTAFAALLLLASWNKLRLTPAIAAGSTQALSALRGSLAAEYGLIALVLAATALMTSLFSPS